MSPLFNEEGEEIEGALSPEEVEAKLQETKESVKNEISQEFEERQQEREEEVNTLKTELETAKEELEKAQNKAGNFKNLREGKEKADEKISELTGKVDELTKTINEKVDGIEKATQEKELKDKIKGVAGEDKDLTEKIEFHYGKLTGEEDAQKRFEAAVTLASGGAGAGSVLQGSVVSGAGGNPMPTGEESKELSPELKEVAKKAGLTDADIEKAKKNNII